MSEVLQANIFFFITSVAVIIFTLLLCIALYHVIKVIKSIRRIVDRIEEGSEVIAEDMTHIRKYFAEGSLFSHIIGLFIERRFSNGSGRTRTKRATKRKGTKLAVSEED